MVEAADWLMTNSCLYKDEGISFNPQWVNQYNEEIVLHENVDNDVCDDCCEILVTSLYKSTCSRGYVLPRSNE